MRDIIYMILWSRGPHSIPNPYIRRFSDAHLHLNPPFRPPLPSPSFPLSGLIPAPFAFSAFPPRCVPRLTCLAPLDPKCLPRSNYRIPFFELAPFLPLHDPFFPYKSSLPPILQHNREIPGYGSEIFNTELRKAKSL